MKKRILLDSSTISRNFSITITKNVIRPLKAESGDIIAFCLLVPLNKVSITASQMKGDEKLLGSNKLSKQRTIIIPELVRKKLKLSIGEQVPFWLEIDGRITIQT